MSRKIEYLIWFSLVYMIMCLAVYVIDQAAPRVVCVSIGMLIIHFLGEHEGRNDVTRTLQQANACPAPATEPLVDVTINFGETKEVFQVPKPVYDKLVSLCEKEN